MTESGEIQHNHRDQWTELDRFCADYEWYAAGGTDEEPPIDMVPVHLRDDAESYARFMDWKYSDGLWESVDRHSWDPEFFRSQFTLIQGGADSSDQTP